MSEDNPLSPAALASASASASAAEAEGVSSCQECHHNNHSIGDVEDLVVAAPPSSRLRSQGWYDPNADSKDHFYHRSWMQNQGHPGHLLDGSHPVIAIINTW
jgi:hypothetical protein